LSNYNIDILNDPHFILYVMLKDLIIFESELNRNGIKYYSNYQENFIHKSIPFYLLESDIETVDHILNKNDILALTETNAPIIDVSDRKKTLVLGLKAYGVVTGIVILIFIIEEILNRT